MNRFSCITISGCISVIIVTIILPAASFSSSGSDFLVYHLRTDQEAGFSTEDGRISEFWDDPEWQNRPLFSKTQSRTLPNGSDDGCVDISLKAAASKDIIALLLTCRYTPDFPDYSSLEVPLDAVSIMLCSSDETTERTAITNMLSIYLTNEPGNLKNGIGRYDASTQFRFTHPPTIEYFETDTTTKVIEIKIPALYVFPELPVTGMRKAFDVRYFSDAFGFSHTAVAFQSVDSFPELAPYRLFNGFFIMEPHFDDSIYVFVTPAENEHVTAGSIYPITWGTTVNGGVIELEYSADKGNSWLSISPAVANDGSHTWQTPDIVSSDCQLRIKSGQTVFAGSPLFQIGHPVPKMLTVIKTDDNLLFQWESVPDISEYRICIDTTSSFSSPLVDDTLSQQTFTFTLPYPSRKLYWKVASALDYSIFSPVDSITPSSSIHLPRNMNHRTHSAAIIPSRNNTFTYVINESGNYTVDLISLKGTLVSVVSSGYKKYGKYQASLPASLHPGTYFVRIRTQRELFVCPFVSLQ